MGRGGGVEGEAEAPPERAPFSDFWSVKGSGFILLKYLKGEGNLSGILTGKLRS